jgi:hypothetical protein
LFFKEAPEACPGRVTKLIIPGLPLPCRRLKNLIKAVSKNGAGGRAARA